MPVLENSFPSRGSESLNYPDGVSAVEGGDRINGKISGGSLRKIQTPDSF